MSQEQEQSSMYDVADKFIALANESAQKDSTATVGMGLRFAAARYSAFEASMAATDLASAKEEFLKIFLDDYRQMLSQNFDAYVEHLAKQSQEG